MMSSDDGATYDAVKQMKDEVKRLRVRAGEYRMERGTWLCEAEKFEKELGKVKERVRCRDGELEKAQGMLRDVMGERERLEDEVSRVLAGVRAATRKR